MHDLMQKKMSLIKGKQGNKARNAFYSRIAGRCTYLLLMFNYIFCIGLGGVEYIPGLVGEQTCPPPPDKMSP